MMQSQGGAGIAWLVMAAVALTGCGASHGPVPAPSNSEADVAAIRAEADAWFKAIAAKDLEGTLSFYAPDAQYMAAGRPAAATPEDRRRLWMEDYQLPGFSSDEVTTKIEVAHSGDLAYQQGTYVFTVQDARGQISKSTGKFVVVWKKQTDQKWKAIIDIDNADQ